ncbi:MAG: protein ImuB, partial [Phenylobacterium sp.]
MMQWLYLHFPRLQLDALEQLARASDEKAHQQPLIIVDRKHNAICQLNRAASDQGLKPGMGLATAIALSAELKVVEYNLTFEQNRIHELAQWLYQIAADIALFEPDGLALEITGMLSLYDDIDNYWQAIGHILQQQQVSYQRAVAKTPLAARLLAKDGHKPLNSDDHLAKRQLNRLPVTRLELAPAHIEQLQRVGITHLNQLWQIPGKELGRRFGLEVLHHLGRIKGDLRQSLSFFEPPQIFSKFLELFHEINQSQVLLFPLKRMAQDMEQFLTGRELVVTIITLTLSHRDGEPMILTIGSATGEYKADKWMDLITLNIERTQLLAPVVGIKLTTGELIEKNATVDDLFSGAKGNMTPAQLVSLLQARVGKDRIVGVQLHQDHRPEYAFSYRPPMMTMPVKKSNKTNKANFIPQFLPKVRPLILLDTPQPLNAPNGPQRYTVLQGPER